MSFASSEKQLVISPMRLPRDFTKLFNPAKQVKHGNGIEIKYFTNVARCSQQFVQANLFAIICLILDHCKCHPGIDGCDSRNAFFISFLNLVKGVDKAQSPKGLSMLFSGLLLEVLLRWRGRYVLMIQVKSSFSDRIATDTLSPFKRT